MWKKRIWNMVCRCCLGCAVDDSKIGFCDLLWITKTRKNETKHGHTMINYSTGNLVQLEKASSCRGLPRIYSSVTQPTRGPFKRVSHNSRLVLDGAFLDILISNRSRHDRVYIAASKQSALLRFLFDDLFRVRCAPSFSLSLSLYLSLSGHGRYIKLGPWPCQ